MYSKQFSLHHLGFGFVDCWTPSIHERKVWMKEYYHSNVFKLSKIKVWSTFHESTKIYCQTFKMAYWWSTLPTGSSKKYSNSQSQLENRIYYLGCFWQRISCQRAVFKVTLLLLLLDYGVSHLVQRHNLFTYFTT